MKKSACNACNQVPEIYFLLLSLYWLLGFYLAHRFICYPILITALLLILLLLIKNRIFGLIMSVILGLGSVFYFLYAIDEADKIAAAPAHFNTFFILGAFLCTAGFFMAGYMLHKYSGRSRWLRHSGI